MLLSLPVWVYSCPRVGMLRSTDFTSDSSLKTSRLCQCFWVVTSYAGKNATWIQTNTRHLFFAIRKESASGTREDCPQTTCPINVTAMLLSRWLSLTLSVIRWFWVEIRQIYLVRELVGNLKPHSLTFFLLKITAAESFWRDSILW